MINDIENKSEPYMGKIQFSRVSCGGRGMKLFGSSLRHGNVISVEIFKAEEHIDSSGVRGSMSRGVPIVKAYMSASQFAEMLTTMNYGDGTECTLRFTQSDGKIDEPADTRTTIDNSIAAFKKKLDDLAAGATYYQKEINQILEKDGNIGKKDREELKKAFDGISQHFSANGAFALECFQKELGKSVVSAKAEVEEFVNHAVVSTGLKALNGIGENFKIIELEQ